MNNRIYLDYNASAPVIETARNAMIAAMDFGGNPSSVHTAGRAARKCLENARQQVADSINAAPRDVIFVGSGTEANNLAMEVTIDRRLITVSTEHDSLLAPARKRDADLAVVSVDHNGLIDLDQLRSFLAVEGQKALVSVMLMNNETGIVQPIQEIAEIVHEFGGYLHCDAVHAFGKIDIDFQTLGADMLSLASHKIGGPKGAGALVVREGLGPFPSIVGGGQERRWRAGTENVIGCAGFGAACATLPDSLSAMYEVVALKDELETAILDKAPDAMVIGANGPRGPNTSTIVMPGIANEKQVMQFDLAGFDVSAGAACSSGKVGASHVLKAMGIADKLAECAIRISLGPTTNRAEIRAFFNEWCKIRDRMKK